MAVRCGADRRRSFKRTFDAILGDWTGTMLDDVTRSLESELYER
jgi:hypothetical protein